MGASRIRDRDLTSSIRQSSKGEAAGLLSQLEKPLQMGETAVLFGAGVMGMLGYYLARGLRCYLARLALGQRSRACDTRDIVCE